VLRRAYRIRHTMVVQIDGDVNKMRPNEDQALDE
jgi:hypothetical protein